MKTGRAQACKARNSLSTPPRSTCAGISSFAVSFAVATLIQSSHGFAGSKVAFNASVTLMTRMFAENIFPQAKTCTPLSSAPLAQSQAKRSAKLGIVLRKRAGRLARACGRRQVRYVSLVPANPTASPFRAEVPV